MKQLQTYFENKDVGRIARHLTGGGTEGPLGISGLYGSSPSFFSALIGSACERDVVLVVVPGNRELALVERDLRFFAARLDPGAGVLPFPMPEVSPYHNVPPHFDIIRDRLGALAELAERGDGPRHGDRRLYIIASAGAILHRTFSPAEYRRNIFRLADGDEIPPMELAARLDGMGYRRVDIVSSCGDYAVRGNVLDVHPVTTEMPVRLVYFGDTVESIRHFEAESQRTIGGITQVLVVPAREYLLDSEAIRVWLYRARRRWSDPAFRRELDAKIEFLETGGILPEMDALHHLLTDEADWTLLDHLGENRLTLVLEPEMVEESLGDFWQKMETDHRMATEDRRVCLAPGEMFLEPDRLRETLETGVTLNLGGAGSLMEDSAITMRTEAGRRYSGRVQDLAGEASTALREKNRIFLVMRTRGKRDRLMQILEEYELQPRVVGDDGPPGPEPHQDVSAPSKRAPVSSPLDLASAVTGLFDLPADRDAGALFILEGDLSAGFRLIDPPVRVVTDDEVFGAAGVAAKKREKRRTGFSFTSDFRDLKPGDYIVHVDHGIGRFVEVRTLERDGAKDFMVVEYKTGDRLMVPLERMDLIQKYGGGEGVKPPLDRLGGQQWAKVKARIKRSMQEMARELINLYAARQLVRGYAFGPDTQWQSEFEESFEFTETPDQIRAIEETKEDMESTRPMDRLVCGDVGYGKTEVAMRAAFKCVMDGKQVAILSPTTVLAYQHHQTFSRRFNAFPITVDLLSRFRSAAKQRKTLEKMAAGEVDVVVGTHRLLSADVKFRDLGLLVVDEEQRFGVAHKEKLKRLRKRVDVLTMTATPIPRTLNMSLAGVRDMSIIETPPRNRLSVHTNVVNFRADLVASAIRKELERDGQVYFVHNRVASIHSMAAYVRRLVPEASLSVAHGQMRESRLESVMLEFMEGKTDVLVTTAIIENGLDIPRVNTILVNRSDRFGLSQLYQLRGRVGRSDRRAFAYLLVPTEQALSSVARKRLAALKEFSELGSGFRIAALDLELRGAGNMLGREQHGHIEAVGFELYTRLLRQAVAELKGETLAEEVQSTINLAVDTHIPDEYITEANIRLSLHKRLASASDEATLLDLQGEIEDRFGPPPAPLENLFEVARLRLHAETLGIESIEGEGAELAIKFSSEPKIDGEKLITYVSGRDDLSFTDSGVLKVPVPASTGMVATAEEILNNLA